jgi:hypothetical protein
VVRAQKSFDLGPLRWRRIDAAGSLDDTLLRAKSELD